MGGACNFIKKEILTQVFSCEFCEISKNTFSCRTPLGDCFCTFFEVTKYYRIIKTLNVVRYLLSNCYFRFSSIISQWTVGVLVRSDKSPFQCNFFCILTNSFMTEAVIIQKPVHWFVLVHWFLYDNGLRHERVKVNGCRRHKHLKYSNLLMEF